MTGIRVVVFDVNETLSDLEPMGRRFADLGVPALMARVWFAGVLRDGFALTAAGGFEHFVAIAEATLRSQLAGADVPGSVEDAVAHIMEGFLALKVHPDVPDGIRQLRDAGLRLTTLTNGSTQVAERLLRQANLLEHFERLMSVDSPRIWKPAAAAYRYAAETCDVPIEQMLLVAVHPWDIDGAARVGMRTAWVDRTGTPYPPYFSAPDYTAPNLGGLAREVVPDHP